MADSHNSIRVPLTPLNSPTWGRERRREPIKFGVPIPAGQAANPEQIQLAAPFNLVTAPQIRSLDTWPDGSIRWALIDVLADSSADRAGSASQTGELPATSPADRVHVSATPQRVVVTTGVATFGFAVDGTFPFSAIEIGARQPIDLRRSGFQIDVDGEPIGFRIAEVVVEDAGPVRAEIALRAISVDPVPVDVSARVELYAGTATARIHITLVNRRPARHPNGQWLLGDEASVLLRSAELVLQIPDAVRRVRCAPERDTPLAEVNLPFELYQESSGGDHWDGPIHRNRDGRVPLRFRGYRIRSGDSERTGARATPIVVVETGRGEIAVTTPRFWEQFPRAIGVNHERIEVGLFPRQSADVYELQGGEQKTHEVVIAFAKDTVCDPPLAWCHDPLLTCPPPAWSCATGAVPFLIPEADDPNATYLSLVATAFDLARGFAAKNERADEYGWRNFGDLHADHESTFQPPDQPLVSHYNNQYDAIAAFAMHFLRSGDWRWRQFMTDLARHVRDIDIYHTARGQGRLQRRAVLAHDALHGRRHGDAPDLPAAGRPAADRHPSTTTTPASCCTTS